MRFLLQFCFPIQLILLLLVSGIGAAEEGAKNSDPWADAMAAVGKTTSDLRFDRYDTAIFGGGDLRLSIFDLLINNPLKVELYTIRMKDVFLRHSNSLHEVLLRMSIRVDEGVRRGLYFNELEAVEKQAEQEDGLLQAFADLYEYSNRRIPGSVRRKVRNWSKEAHPVLHKSLALLVGGVAQGLEWHRMAFENVDAKKLKKMADRVHRLPLAEEGTMDWDVYRLITEIDYKFLYAGALDIAQAVDRAAVQLLSASRELYAPPLNIETPLGEIRVGTTGSDRFERLNHLFIVIDLGGNDVYQSGGTSQYPDHPVGIVIDLDGDDSYEGADTSSCSSGAGILGYGFIIDATGNDRYTAEELTQGCGVFGVGAILDGAGNDTYSAVTCAQGSAQYGLGLLIDTHGNDTYQSYRFSQGYGFTKGCGLLIDRDGDDLYDANDSDIRFPSGQTPEHNDSQCQGAGAGLRGDLWHGHSLGGGFGMLVDAAGNDCYRAGIFAQGVAYWYSTGILVDGAGDDVYQGVWYVQGSAAHFGAGFLIDESGNDLYHGLIHVAQGGAHDFSLAMLVDRSGDDTYRAANLSQGAANANAIGILLDRAGNDRYETPHNLTIGASQIGVSERTLRDFMFSLGLFLDLGGHDTYPQPYQGNNKTWVQREWERREFYPEENGVGLDGEYLGR
ncbi:MAG: hypothetical protein ABIH23_14815 [bacterium]